MSETTTELTEGCIAVDRDDDRDDTRLHVVATYDDRADEFHIDAMDATVAEANPEYPPGDDVVVAVYREDVIETLGVSATGDEIRRAAAFDELRTYTFPRSRLRLAVEGVTADE